MNRGESPLIAVNGVLVPDETGEPKKLSLRTRYAEAVARAGGIPVALLPVSPALGADLDGLLARVDGLLLTGGDDFETERLGLGPTHPKAVKTPAAKQDWDLELARRAVALDLPMLGICYGMQCLVLGEGGGLFQHLPDDRPGCQEHTGSAIHPVSLESGSKLRTTMGVGRVDVVSRHHQAISEPGPQWAVAARDDEGLIEAVERPASSFALAVQWHPELSPAGSPHDRLFEGLVDAARQRRISSQTVHA